MQANARLQTGSMSLLHVRKFDQYSIEQLENCKIAPLMEEYKCSTEKLANSAIGLVIVGMFKTVNVKELPKFSQQCSGDRHYSRTSHQSPKRQGWRHP